MCCLCIQLPAAGAIGPEWERGTGAQIVNFLHLRYVVYLLY
jgi:hypothetical protein